MKYDYKIFVKKIGPEIIAENGPYLKTKLIQI